MARIRTIKPEFQHSESMGRVSRDARLLFIELWPLCDDEGRTRGSSRMLASLLFPYDEDAPDLIESWLAELEREKCIVRYQGADDAGAATYIEVCNWSKHQKIDRPSKSKLPAFVDSSRAIASARERSSVDLDRDQGSGTKGSVPGTSRAPRAANSLEAFDAFWDAYDRKVARPAAERAWRRIKPDADLAATIVAKARLYAASTPDKGYRRHPARWLREEGWNDELTTRSSGSRSSNGAVPKSTPVGRYLSPGEDPVQDRVTMAPNTITKLPEIKRAHVVVANQTRTCQQHGDYVASHWALEPPSRAPFAQPFWSKCPTCAGDMQREADARDAEIRGGLTPAKAAAAARRREAGIPARFSEATVWNWLHPIDAQRRCWDVARDYCNGIVDALQSGRSIVFCGGPGTGKTHLAIGLLRHCIEKGGTGIYTTAADLVGRIRATYSREADQTEQQVIDLLCSVDLLVVDEVGRQFDTAHEHAQMFRVLDGRYRQRKAMVLVSNIPKANLIEHLGDAIADRLREAGGALLVFDWASHRSARKREAEQP